MIGLFFVGIFSRRLFVSSILKRIYQIKKSLGTDDNKVKERD
jgi:hypothetical protein